MVMCPEVWNNPGKPGLIPHVALRFMDLKVKDFGRFRISPPPIS